MKQLTIEDMLDEAPTRLALTALDQPLLRPADAARLLGVRVSWVYEAVRDGRLPCIRVGRHIRFTRAMLEHWLEAQIDSRERRMQLLRESRCAPLPRVPRRRPTASASRLPAEG